MWLGMMLLLLGLGGASRAEDPNLGTVFSYQGRLETAGSEPLNGSYDFKFQVYDIDGTPIGEIMVEPNITVTEGIFTVQLDPDPNGTVPNLFNGEVRYLEIAVRETGSADPNYFTISPRQRIHAAPYAITASSARWLRGRNSTEKVVYVDDSGNVGIGTTSPSQKLDVVGNATVSGNVGIGTTSPTAKLEVNGNIKTAGVYEDDLGNVGIGTTSPTAKLEVNGTVVSQNIVYKTANQVEKIYGLHSDNDLKFYMKANTKYQFEFIFFVYREDGHEIKFKLQGPSNTINLIAQTMETRERIGDSDDPYDSVAYCARLNSPTYAHYHYQNMGGNYYTTCKIRGTVETGSDSGNLELLWGPVITNTNDYPKVYKGSYVIYREIP